jgi:hypothetical protein
MRGPYTTRSTADRVELAALAHGREPGATRALGAVRDGRPGRDWRAWVVDGPGGPVAALVEQRICRDRRTALPLLVDAGAAPALAGLVDASRAATIAGPEPDVRALAPHLRRLRGDLDVRPVVVLDGVVDGITPASVDPRTRLAGRSDLDVLVELYARYELLTIPTRRRLRGFLRDRVDEGRVAVLVEHDRVLAAGYVSALGPAFAVMTGLTAAPESRGRGLGLAIIGFGAMWSKEHGVRMAAVWAASNGIRLTPARLARWVGDTPIEGWAQGWLGFPPSRVRGTRRLLRAVERLEGPLDRREAVHVTNQLPPELAGRWDDVRS